MKTIITVLLVLPVVLSAQQKPDLDQLAMEMAKASVDELYEMLSIPNDANYPDEIIRNIQWAEGALAKRGFQTQRLETNQLPLLIATRNYPRAKKTLLVYLQMDGQPVDSSRWYQESPWIPTLKRKLGDEWEAIDWDQLNGEWDPEWRIFCRSASDAKGPVMMFMKSLDILNQLKYNPNFNLKLILDFQEEQGSPALPDAVKRYGKELAADMFVIFDGPMHTSNLPTLSYGARGIARVTLEVYGPRVPQHSGHYGNYAPNPAVRLAQLIATFKDEEGRVLIPGWYDGIELSEDVKKVLANVPDDEVAIQKKLGIGSTDKVADTYQASLQFPSLNVRGMQSGWVRKEVRTIIPATAIAEIDIRLVKESDPERLIRLLRAHIENQGYYITEGAPTEDERMLNEKVISFQSRISYLAFRTDLDSDIGAWLRKGVRAGFGEDPVEIRTMGGSIPISPFVITLNVPAVAIPTVNPDNNQHSPNENMRLGNYVDGIKMITSILMQKM